jgi:hypothetical protein
MQRKGSCVRKTQRHGFASRWWESRLGRWPHDLASKSISENEPSVGRQDIHGKLGCHGKVELI